MAKIPFDIKFRPQIESGEYKVETRDGRAVRIICWDAKGLCPIIYLLRSTGFGGDSNENPCHCTNEGNYCNRATCQDEDLFLITPEPEMSEMEALLFSWLSHDTGGRTPMKQEVKARATKLLALAKKQLLQTGELLTQEHHEKLMETQYNEMLDGVKKNWRDYFTPQAVTDIYNAGRNDVLKDLPMWKKATGKERFNKRMIVLVGDNDLLCTNYAEEGEYYLPFSDLEKLPKEDESHE